MRSLRKNWGFATTAVLILTVGFGFSMAVVEAAQALLMRPPGGIEDAGRLVRVRVERVSKAAGGELPSDVSYPDFVDIRDAVGGAAVLAGYQEPSIRMFQWRGSPQRALVASATGNLLRVLRVSMAHGRPFQADDDNASATPVMVLSHQFWTSQLGGDLAVLGAAASIDGRTLRVVGVADSAFRGLDVGRTVDAWITLSGMTAIDGQSAAALDRNYPFMSVVARPDPAWSRSRLSALVRAAVARLDVQYPVSETRRTAHLTGIAAPSQSSVERSWRGLLSRALAIASALGGVAVLCVGILQLVRQTLRSNELVMHFVLGAHWMDVAGPVIAEAALLSILGCAAALAAALAAFRSLTVVVLGVSLEPIINVSAVAAYAVAVGVVTVALTVVPLWRARRTSAAHLFRQPGIGSRLRSWRALNAIAVVQVAVFAALMFWTLGNVVAFRRLRALDLGYAPHSLVAVQMRQVRGGAALNAETEHRRYVSLANEFRSFAAVEAASVAASVPLGTYSSTSFGAAPTELSIPARFDYVDERYFTTLGIQVRDGAPVDLRDPDGVVVSRALAARLWRGERPIDKCLYAGLRPGCLHVVGVVDDVRFTSLEDRDAKAVYLPWNPAASEIVPVRTLFLRARNGTGTLSLEKFVRARVPADILVSMWALSEDVKWAQSPARRSAILLTLLSISGLLLVVVGHYGLLAYFVRQTRTEIGIRMALGARPARIVIGVIGPTVWTTAIGSVAGIGIAYAIGRVLTTDSVLRPEALVLGAWTVVTLCIIALISALVPSVAAASINPADAMRGD